MFYVSGSNYAVKGSLINIENLNSVTLDQDKWGPNYSGTFREYGEAKVVIRERLTLNLCRRNFIDTDFVCFAAETKDSYYISYYVGCRNFYNPVSLKKYL